MVKDSVKKFLKSGWFPLSLFLALELIALRIGSLLPVNCKTGVPCSSFALPLALISAVPNGSSL